jgi:predicted ATPase
VRFTNVVAGTASNDVFYLSGAQFIIATHSPILLAWPGR